MPLVNSVYTGIPPGDTSEYLQGTLEHQWKTQLKLSHTGAPLEKLLLLHGGQTEDATIVSRDLSRGADKATSLSGRFR